jgi:hypothetical protein
LLITEVQTGNAARADEFVELYNTTDLPLDLSGWQLRYITASATSTKNLEDPSTIIQLATPIRDGTPLLLPPGGYYLLYAGVVALPSGAMGQQYDGVLPATGGSLVLLEPDNQTCELVIEDAVAWGSTTHLFGNGEALVPGSGSSVDRLYQRFVDSQGVYVDTDNNAQDFLAVHAALASASPTPAAPNGQVLPAILPVGSGVQSLALPVRINNVDCTIAPEPEPQPDPGQTPPVESPPSVTDPPAADPEPEPDQPTIPDANVGLKSPLLSELLPNPASPQTDQDDEFIELYNPNDSPFDLSGYVLEVGLTTKKRHIIPQGTELPSHAFLALFSADTNLTLSNSGSQVVLVDPLGAVLASSTAYGVAKDGQSWVLANGTWQWTTKPTPNGVNVITTPSVKKASTKKTKAATVSKTTSTPKPTTTLDTSNDIQQAANVAATAGVPLHPGVLALVGVFALLYGAYEYRHDVANKLYQFRTNRTARRAARQSAEGR